MALACQPGWVNRRAWVQMSALAGLWGASYMFIKIAIDDVSPIVVVWVRLVLAALVLVPIAHRRGAFAALRPHLATIVLLAVVQVAAPFLLITFGEKHIASSLAGILVATAPIFTFLLAFAIDQEERTGAIGVLGVGAGIGGVVLLLGVDTSGTAAALLGGLMVVLASLGYALGSYYLKRRFKDTQPVGVVAATMTASALLSAPFAALDLPAHAPGGGAIAAVSTLGVVGTGIAFVMFYELIATVGPAKATLVAYLAPGFAVVYGVLLLGEKFTLATAAGLVLIIVGSWPAAEGRLPRFRARSAAGALARRAPQL